MLTQLGSIPDRSNNKMKFHLQTVVAFYLLILCCISFSPAICGSSRYLNYNICHNITGYCWQTCRINASLTGRCYSKNSSSFFPEKIKCSNDSDCWRGSGCFDKCSQVKSEVPFLIVFCLLCLAVAICLIFRRLYH